MNDVSGPASRSRSPQGEAPAPVLLADDDERTLFSLSEALSNLDVDVVCAVSGREVLREVLRRDFAVILLDARMPELDGYQTAGLLREREKSQHIPIIFLTGLDKDVSHIFRGYAAGAVDYVFKPVDPFVLRAKVAVFLDLYRQAEKIQQQFAHTRQLLDENIRTRKVNDAYAVRLQHLSRQLITLQDMERRSLAHELHDQIGQSLTALILSLQSLTKGRKLAKPMSSLLDESIATAQHVVSQIRNMSLELHPMILEDIGLEATLNWYLNGVQERTDLIIETVFNLKTVTLSADESTACYRIVQSAFTNILRHAKATNVRVRLRRSGNSELILSVADNGVGFNQEHVSRLIQQGRCFGLTAMRERALLVGGKLDVSSREGEGTVVRLRLPLGKKSKMQAG